MKKTLMIFAAIVMMAGFSTTVMAQKTITADAGAKIIVPITLTQTTPLNFGTMSVLTASAGTCVLSTAGVRTATGGVNLSSLAPTFANGFYTVGGEIAYTYSILLPSSVPVSSGANSLTISALFARTASAGIDGLTGTLSAAGDDTFTVGGTLTVPAGQSAGVYAGTFDVTVAYN